MAHGTGHWSSGNCGGPAEAKGQATRRPRAPAAPAASGLNMTAEGIAALEAVQGWVWDAQ